MSDSQNGGSATGKRTFVEEGSVFKGTLDSTCPIVVMGKIEGDVSGPSLEVAETGLVSGQVKVAHLRSRGEIAGTIEAETVELAGRVRDQTIIRAKSLEVELGRAGGQDVVFGGCELCIGDEPVKMDAISSRGNGHAAPAEPKPPEPQPETPAQPQPVVAPAQPDMALAQPQPEVAPAQPDMALSSPTAALPIDPAAPNGRRRRRTGTAPVPIDTAEKP